ncbi:MAG TPA: hypothetical protein VF705_07140, partial [Longimicrobium sp.]
MQRTTTSPRAKQKSRPLEEFLFDRLMTGAVLGFVVGVLVQMVLRELYVGAQGGTGRGAFAFRLFGGAIAGGMLAAWLFPRARRLAAGAASAAAVGAALMAVVTAAPLLATWPCVRHTPAGVALYLALSTVVGAAAGLIGRDALQFAARDKTPSPPHRQRPPPWVLLLVELGWRMESLPTPRTRRRDRLRRQPMPDAWIEII